MRGAVVIVVGIVVALIAFRSRGATTPPRRSDPKPAPASGRPPPRDRPGARHGGGLRQAWRAQVAAFQRATRIITAVIIVYMVFVIWREFF